MEELGSFLVVFIAVILATIGYTMIYKAPRRVLLHCIIAALLGWYANDIANVYFNLGSIVAALVASMVVALYSEIMARVVKVPVSIIMIIGVLPLVPGSTIYFTIEALIQNELSNALSLGLEAIGIALALAMGMMVVSTFVQIYFKTLKFLRTNRKKPADETLLIDIEEEEDEFPDS